MEEIVFNKNLTKFELLQHNILIENPNLIEDGAILENSIIIKGNTQVEAEARVGSFSILNNATIKSNAQIQSSQIENSIIGKNSTVGPFARIRQNCVVGQNNRIGNFVELKNATTGNGCKMAHLAYVGDAVMGNNCNIGCGVVFCNYNGKIKQQCTLGNNVFVGSNVNLIAPVKIGNNAYIAAGSTINKNVEDDCFAIARHRQETKTDFKNPYVEN